MGNVLGQKPVRVLMLGLDGAGKTTILYKLKLGRVVETISTIGYNTEKIHYKSREFCILEFGGHEKIRWLWYRYCHHIKAVIFVVDTSDRQRMPEVKDLLTRLLGTRELDHAYLLIYANRRNVPDAMTREEITAELELSELTGRPWLLTMICATDSKNDDLFRGFDWLREQVRTGTSKRKKDKRIVEK